MLTRMTTITQPKTFRYQMRSARAGRVHCQPTISGPQPPPRHQHRLRLLHQAILTATAARVDVRLIQRRVARTGLARATVVSRVVQKMTRLAVPTGHVILGP